MKLKDYGETPDRSFFQSILEWSRKKVGIDDNLDCVTIETYLGTSETIVDHPLGRVPKGIISILSFPNNTTELTWDKAPTNSRLFIHARTAGKYSLLIY